MEERKLISKGGIIFDLFVTLLFGIFMTWVCADHAPPAAKESTRLIVGAFAATPITGTFWLALNLCRVTVVDMFRRRKENKDF